MNTFTIPPNRAHFELPGRSPGCLLVHGFMGDTREMRPLAAAISAQLGYYVYAPLLPGHGGPPHLMAGLHMADFLDVIYAALAKVRAQHDSVVVCAFSMGGALAAQVIRAQPVAAFVGLAPMFAIRHPLLPLAPLARYFLPWVHPLKLMSVDDLGLRDDLLSYDPMLDLDDPTTLSRLKNELRFPVPITDELRIMAIHARESARAIHTPTLIVQGRTDLTLNPVGAERFFEQLPGTDKQLRMIPGSGHNIVNPDNPGHTIMVETVIDWLRARFG